MKRIKHLWIACLCILLTASQCKKDLLGKLPPETQTGANTFGCLVNGEAWVPTGTNPYSGQNVLAKYEYSYPSPTGYTLIITAHDYEGKPRSFFNIGMDSTKLASGSVLNITNKKGNGGGTFSKNDENSNYVTYYTNDSLSGSLQITKLDEVNQIISGTFWFDAINRFGEKVEVREGRFDIKYTR